MGRKFEYDYLVIGSGPAGLTGAKLAKSLGRKVAIIEDGKWGGSQNNYRDVPFNACLKFSHLFAEAREGAKFGLSSNNLRFNYPTVNYWRSVATKRANSEVDKLQSSGIDFYNGFAHFIDPHEVAIKDSTLRAKKILLATGSSPSLSGIFGLDRTDFLTPDTALAIDRLPKTLTIVGGGSTGVELGQYFAELGVDTTVIELSSRILPREDEEVSGILCEYLAQKFPISFLPQTRVTAVQQSGYRKQITILKNGKEEQIFSEQVIIAIGQTPNLDLGLENAKVKYDSQGVIVDSTLRTTAKHIFAAGDIINNPLSSTELANYQGAIATANALKKSRTKFDLTGFASVIDTYPQLARVGLTSDACLKSDLKINQTIFPISNTQAANTEDFQTGFVKLITNRKGLILGCSILAPEAKLLVQEISLAIKHQISVSDLASTPHVASSWSEAIRSAAKSLS